MAPETTRKVWERKLDHSGPLAVLHLQAATTGDESDLEHGEEDVMVLLALDGPVINGVSSDFSTLGAHIQYGHTYAHAYTHTYTHLRVHRLQTHAHRYTPQVLFQ